MFFPHPSEKYSSQIGSWNPKTFGVEMKKSLSCHHLWPNGIIFHQLRFPWILRRFPLLFTTIWGYIGTPWKVYNEIQRSVCHRGLPRCHALGVAQKVAVLRHPPGLTTTRPGRRKLTAGNPYFKRDYLGVSKNRGIPKMDQFIMENPH